MVEDVKAVSNYLVGWDHWLVRAKIILNVKKDLKGMKQIKCVIQTINV